MPPPLVFPLLLARRTAGAYLLPSSSSFGPSSSFLRFPPRPLSLTSLGLSFSSFQQQQHRSYSSRPTPSSFFSSINKSSPFSKPNFKPNEFHLLFGGILSSLLLLSYFKGSYFSPPPLPGSETNWDPTKEVPYTTVGPGKKLISAKSMVEQPKGWVEVVGTAVMEWVVEPIMTVARFFHLAALFVPVILLVPVVWIGRRERLEGGGKERGERAGAVWWYGVLVRQMQRAGPSFIKLAQWAGSRSDLFPHRLCEAFGQLHSNGKPHSFHHTKKVIERVFKRPFEEVFEEFDEVPIGCGAIAQVYKATLRPDILPPSYHSPKHQPNPTTSRLTQALDPLPPSSPPPAATAPTSAVAIKILHPRVESTIRRDLKIMSFFASLLNSFPGMEWLSFPEEVDVFGAMMNQQLDLNVEAENLERFERNFMYRRGAVSFPRPVRDYSTREVLVEEFENALPLKWFLRNGGGEYDEQLAGMGLDAFLNMLLLDNWTHGDLHPGNIMVKFFKPSTSALFKNLYAYLLGLAQTSSPTAVSPQAKDDSDAIVAKLSLLAHDPKLWLEELHELFEDGWQPELVFIDAGLVTQLDGTNRRNFLDLFQALAEFDGYRAGTLMVQRCKTPELVLDPETFALKIQHLVLSVKSKTFSLARIRISDILGEVLTAVRVNHVKMEGDFVNTILSILLLEGIGRRLDPELDLFQSALPILRQVGGRAMAGTGADDLDGVGVKDLGAMIKLWIWMEARALAGGAVVDWEAFVRYDWLSPNL
ncbi:hypothetical protein BDY24DRAFT_375784 [Mrakia frigida]|uniref:Cqd1p n=1 Tax=Mrakia frigida TaxID=29902 RepID=UPI003FCC02D6